MFSPFTEWQRERPNGGRPLVGGSCSSVRNLVCCIWNGQLETDALSRYIRTTMQANTRSVWGQVRTVLLYYTAESARKCSKAPTRHDKGNNNKSIFEVQCLVLRDYSKHTGERARAHMHARTPARTYACTRAHKHTHTHVHARTQTSTHVHTRTHSPIRTHTCVHTHARTHPHTLSFSLRDIFAKKPNRA